MTQFSTLAQAPQSVLKAASFLPLFSILFSLQAFAHGEDKPGPHGGYIRMPGAFHTELVQEGKSSFDVYLLDMEWKNPTVADSSVEAVLKGTKSDQKLKCEADGEKFNCRLPSNTKTQKGNKILITAKRKGMQGSAASYQLPLTFTQSH